jgi:hypothetical protein
MWFDARPHMIGEDGSWLLRALKELIPSGIEQYDVDKDEVGELSRCARRSHRSPASGPGSHCSIVQLRISVGDHV